MKQIKIQILLLLFALQTTDVVYAQHIDNNQVVSTKYTKTMVFTEPHDNIIAGGKLLFIKEATYENGKVETTTYEGPNFMYSGGCACGGIGISYGDTEIPGFYGNSDTKIRYGSKLGFSSEPLNKKGEITNRYTKTGVPELSNVEFKQYYEHPGEELEYVNDLSSYLGYFTINGVNIRGQHFNPENPIEAWYNIGGLYEYSCYGKYPLEINGEKGSPTIRDYRLSHDSGGNHFLYYGGNIIDYRAFGETFDPDFRIEDITMPNGMPAKVVTMDLQIKYLNRDLYKSIVDTIYQLTPDEIKQMNAIPARVKFHNKTCEMRSVPHPITGQRTTGIKPEE